MQVRYFPLVTMERSEEEEEEEEEVLSFVAVSA
jgi:hypothetical protein